LSFDTSTITEVFPPSWQGGRLKLEWTSSSPSGTYFQVYVAGVFAWYGTDRHCTIAPPSGLTDIQIGSVGTNEQTTDFSGSLTVYTTRAKLTWESGSDAASFNIYSGTVPGGAVSYASPVATVTALEQGINTDGYNYGGYNAGGYDGGGSFSWTSGPLAIGTWNFAVKPVDAAGNEGSASTVSVTIHCPPRPPARNSDGDRLTYSYSSTIKKVTLTWLASPG